MIIDKARELGIALSETEEFLRMVAAREAMENDENVNNMLEEYQSKQDQIVDMLSEPDCDRDAVVAMTADVERIQAALICDPVFSELMDAQNDFQQLMAKVNSVIGSCIGMEPQPSDGGCSGSCSSCSGCKH